MASVAVINPKGVASGTVELADGVFGLAPNVPLMHQVVTAQLARRRAGTQSTKTRSEVSGGGKKPFKQKGTGNARQGSTRAPHWVGGGVALGPKPRKYGQRTPKKMIALALRSALSDRASAGKIIVVDGWTWERPSTKAANVALGAIGATGRTLIVVDRDDENTVLSFRNLPSVQLIDARELNAYDVLVNETIVFSQATLPTAAPSSRKRSIVAPATGAPADAASGAGDATVTRRVTVRTIVEGVETVEVMEETVESVDAATIPDYHPDSIDTTVVRRERTIVDGEVVDSSETMTSEESDQ